MIARRVWRRIAIRRGDSYRRLTGSSLLVRLTVYSSYWQYGDPLRAGRQYRCEEDRMNTTTGIEVLADLIDAVNRHDLDALVRQFADDVRSETPAHPARSFIGNAQVRNNWSQI